MPLFGNTGRKQERRREKEQLQELQTERRKTELTLTKTTQKTKKERQRKMERAAPSISRQNVVQRVLSSVLSSVHSGFLSIMEIQKEETLGVQVSSSVMMELIAFDSAASKLICSTTSKLQEVLYKVCKLDADLMFTYGSFGYGYSHQKKHPGRMMEDLVKESLFLRCPPPEDRRDPNQKQNVQPMTSCWKIPSSLPEPLKNLRHSTKSSEVSEG